jgi:hypothetical protein
LVSGERLRATLGAVTWTTFEAHRILGDHLAFKREPYFRMGFGLGLQQDGDVGIDGTIVTLAGASS